MVWKHSIDEASVSPKKRRKYEIKIDIPAQPNEVTCGPTALHAVYQYYHDTSSLDDIMREVHQFEDGGTLAAWLGCHALKRGYDAILYSYNLQLLDPTWFLSGDVDLTAKLLAQADHKKDARLLRTAQAFVEYLELGGKLRMEDMNRSLIRKYLIHGVPVLTGLSSTFLYRSAREVPPEQYFDDILGLPTGHFVILCGYETKTKMVLVGDPHGSNPYSNTRKYKVPIDRVISAILLGVLTYDANFLVIRPKGAALKKYADSMFSEKNKC